MFCFLTGLTLDVGLVGALFISLYVFATPAEDESWESGFRQLVISARGWLDQARGNFQRLTTWGHTSPLDLQRRQLEESWAEEDRAYQENLGFAITAREKAQLRAAYRQVLLDRQKELPKLQSYTMGTGLVFAFLSVILPVMFVAGFFMKNQIANEVLVGGQLLKPWTLNLWFTKLPFTMVNVVSVAMVAAEVLAGLFLSVSSDRLEQIRKSEVDEPTQRYRVIQGVSLGSLVVLAMMEGVFGYFRGQLETQGSLLPTIWLIFLSIGISVATSVGSYLWKTSFNHLSEPFGKFLRLVIMALGWVFNGLWVAVCGLVTVVTHTMVFQAYVLALWWDKIQEERQTSAHPEPVVAPEPAVPPEPPPVPPVSSPDPAPSPPPEVSESEGYD